MNDEYEQEKNEEEQEENNAHDNSYPYLIIKTPDESIEEKPKEED